VAREEFPFVAFPERINNFKHVIFLWQVASKTGRTYSFFLSSEYERSQWVEALKTLQASLPPNTSQVSGRHLGLVWPQRVEALKTLQASLPPNTSQVSGRHLGLVWSQWVEALKTLQASLPPNTSQVSGSHLGLVWSR
jgi:hypothetical protein